MCSLRATCAVFSFLGFPDWATAPISISVTGAYPACGGPAVGRRFNPSWTSGLRSGRLGAGVPALPAPGENRVLACGTAPECELTRTFIRSTGWEDMPPENFRLGA